MNTYQEVRPLATIGDGKELIQWSERDGWAHLYLYDGEGNLKNRITRGPWHVDQIVKVDEAKRVVYFLANGKEKDENPYYEHLYRVGLDGSGLDVYKRQRHDASRSTNGYRYGYHGFRHTRRLP